MMGWFVEKLEFFLELEGSDDLISITSYFALFKTSYFALFKIKMVAQKSFFQYVIKAYCLKD